MKKVKTVMKNVFKSGGLVLYNNLNPKNKLRFGRKNTLQNNGAILNGVVVQIRGVNNTVVFGNNSRLDNCRINIFGDNNIISIGENCLLIKGVFWMEDNENRICIGDKTSIHGKTEFAAIEGTKIIVGEDCMFSSNILFRTGDSHSIIDLVGVRTNPSKDISLGNHVWVCAEVICLKGVSIPDHTIIGARSLLTQSFFKKNTIIAGAPASVVKEDVDWLRERIATSN